MVPSVPDCLSAMQYSVEYRVYHRPFSRPLRTHHGLWQTRSGILLRLQNENGQIRYGEIAPLEWFGTESLSKAIAHCQKLTPSCGEGELRTIPDHLPACQFGFEAALESFVPVSYRPISTQNSVLLPTGIEALDVVEDLPSTPGMTCKWKIGVRSLTDELPWFDRILATLPNSVQIRLDANGGLSMDDAERWLERCDRTHQVEFLEQPLAPAQFEAMLRLSHQFQTAIALDESVASLSQLEQCLNAGWSGIVVLKAAIMGSPQRLRQIHQAHSLDIVWSSVFETAIAQRYMFERLIPSVSGQRPRDLGFGINQWFNDEWFYPCSDEWLWQHLGQSNLSSTSDAMTPGF